MKTPAQGRERTSHWTVAPGGLARALHHHAPPRMYMPFVVASVTSNEHAHHHKC